MLLSLIKENLGGIIVLIFVSTLIGTWYLSKWKSKLDDIRNKVKVLNPDKD